MTTTRRITSQLLQLKLLNVSALSRKAGKREKFLSKVSRRIPQWGRLIIYKTLRTLILCLGHANERVTR